jgi:hypothetical protein
VYQQIASLYLNKLCLVIVGVLMVIEIMSLIQFTQELAGTGPGNFLNQGWLAYYSITTPYMGHHKKNITAVHKFNTPASHKNLM